MKKEKAKVPQEGFADSMSILNSTVHGRWRPNNYRRKLKIRGLYNSTLDALESAIIKRNEGIVTRGKRNKLIFWKRQGVTLQIGPRTITAIHDQRDMHGKKVVFEFFAKTEAELDLALDSKKKEIRKMLDDVIVELVKRYELEPRGVIDWDRHEDEDTADGFLQSIPKEAQFFVPGIGRKVYDKGFEFTGGELEEPTRKYGLYIKNRALEYFAPAIVEQIKALADSQKRMATEALEPLTAQIVLHLKVQEKTLQVQEENLALLKEQREKNRDVRVKNLRQEWGW